MLSSSVRWTVARKRELVEQVRAHPESRTVLLGQHSVSDEEFAQWELDLSTAGDLRVTRIQDPKRVRIKRETVG